MIKAIRNLATAMKLPKWRRALLIAIISDILSFVFALIPPVQWGVDLVTAILLVSVLGFRWPLLIAMIIEVIPAIELFPAWTLVILALAAAGDQKPEM